jgi:N-methylhydantoinase A
LHATAVARELGIPRVLIPARPGLTNALGCLVADLRHDFVRTLNLPLEQLDSDRIRMVLEEQIEEGHRLIEGEHIGHTTISVQHRADMQFQGQSHLLSVNLASAEIGIDELRALFGKAYWHRFQVELPELHPVLVNLHTAVIGARKVVPIEALNPDGGSRPNRDESRQVWFGGQWMNTPICQREHLFAGQEFSGPAIIEQLDATTVVEPHDYARIDACGNIIIELRKRI